MIYYAEKSLFKTLKDALSVFYLTFYALKGN